MKAFKRREVATIEHARKDIEKNVVTTAKVTVSEEIHASISMEETTKSRKQRKINNKDPKVIVMIVNTVITSAEIKTT